MLVSDPLAAIPLLANLTAEDLDLVIEQLTDPANRPTDAHVLTRAYARGLRFERDHDPATLTGALADLAASRYDGPYRGLVARSLVVRQMQAAVLGQPFDQPRIRRMIDEAGDDPALPHTADMLQVMVDAVAALVDDPAYDRADALRRLDGVQDLVPPDSQYGSLLTSLRIALAVKRGQDGNLHDARQAAEYAREMLARGDLGPQQQLMAEAMLLGAEGMQQAQSGDMTRAFETVDQMAEVVDRLPANDPAAVSLRNLIANLTGADASAVGLSDSERAFRLLTSAMRVLGPALDNQDPAGIERGVRILREAASVAPADYPHRVMILSTLGRMLCAQFQLGAGRAALDEALLRLEEAKRSAAHPGHPLWAPTATALGIAYRLAGRRAEGRAWGQRALRGHAWSVLLQAGTADAATAARDASTDAVEVARWCIVDGDHAGAAAALDSGRCLMLYAATVAMDIPSRLRGLDRHDLLHRWKRDPEDADLRREVLTALTGGPLSEASVPEVLDPPPGEEIRRALVALDVDVLVYLLPGGETGLGGALLVPSGDRPYHLTLPRLTEVSGAVERHVRRLGVRDAGGVEGLDPEEDQDWRSSLNDLCDWAWTAAVGPLLIELRRWRLGRPARVVLIPMARLAAVPWHAARDRHGSRAVEQAVFSYAPSARLLCQNAWRSSVPVDAGGLVVGDPTLDLPDARAEAEAIRTAFYPEADLLGETDATPAAVMEWLRRTEGSRSVLHLACHGQVTEGIDGSYLVLAGGRRLPARQVLETRRSGTIGVVALAACTTNVPSGAYDESFSLSTAFLAAGARTVFGSLWPVPDGATSLMMFLVHHYLRVDRLRPVDALHRAQLWMLNPERRPPPTMPPHLATRVAALDSDDVAAWAGFTHQGR
ncbi:CHAT domain-containing protein [Micromonospora sp. MED01]|uniref:CHAT domain-containing protein n=1 Tax=Micromonospora alfalfae TaxID=2911212 RepID=UPI001EE7D302|nr:CHAT domain-containing protein [Micromonospora alfalfae]MCG5467026.1 CHAT domain-containing protein [Micromonospora alfalfae]